MKIIKRIGIILASLLILLVVAAIVVPMFIDMSFIKPIAADAVKKQTGRDLYMDGDIKITILPRIGVKIKQISISNAVGFAPEKMLSIGETQVGVKVLPLLSKKIEVSNVIVDDVDVQYSVNKNGVTNVDDILAFMDAAAAESVTETPQEPAPAEDAASSSMNIDIANSVVGVLQLSNIKATYSDEKTGIVYNLAADLQASNLGLNASPHVTGKAILSDTKGNVIDADLDVDITLSEAIASVKTNKTLINVTLPEQDAGLNAVLSLNADYMMETKSLAADFNADVKTAIAAKQLDLNLATSVNYDMTIGVIDISSLNAKLRAAGVLENEQSVDLDTAAKVNLQQETLELKSLKITGAGLNVQGTATGTKIMSDPNVKGVINIAEFSPKALLSELGIDIATTDAKALTKLSGKIDIQMAKKVFTVPLSLKLDDSTINANVKANIAGKVPVITATAKLDSINANRYLPPAEAKGAKAPAQASPSATATAATPTSLVPDIDLDFSALPKIDVTATIGDLSIMDERIKGISIAATLNNSILTVKSSIADLHGGKITADTKVTGVKGKFEADLKANASAINLKSVLNTYAPDVKIQGNAVGAAVNLNYKGSSKLLNVSSFSASLDRDTISGNITAELKPARPNVTLNVKMGDLDLGKYLPKTEATTGAPAAATSSAPAPASAATPIDLKTLIPADVDATVTIKSVKYDKFALTDLFTHLIFKDGTIKVAPFTANTFGGSIKLETDIKGLDNSSTNTYKLNLSNIKVENIMKTFSGKDSKVTGNLSASADLAAAGIDVNNILATLEGKAQYTLENAIVYGIGYNPNLLSLDTIKNFNLFGNNKNTPVKTIRGSVTIHKGGRINLEPVHMTADNLTIDLAGSVLALERTYDMKGAVEISSISVPLTVTGPLASPKVEIDQAKLISGLIVQYTKETTKGAISLPLDAIDGVNKELDKGLNKLGEGLNKLFN